jgi:hypothetical protein
VLVAIATIWSGPQLISRPSEFIGQWWSPTGAPTPGEVKDSDGSSQSVLSGSAGRTGTGRGVVPTKEVAETHHELFSLSTPDGKYFPVIFGDYGCINPNIIPHPSQNDTWIIVGQEFTRGSHAASTWNVELVCDATFRNGSLQCVKQPMLLPIPATTSPVCLNELELFNFNIGPHDARVFFGPEYPYIIYGSQSLNSCFGQWIQDFRMLVNWGHHRNNGLPFQVPTDMQRPPPYSPLEKNWFVFWDAHGDMYAHYDVSPKRSFARFAPDGSVGVDLAPLAGYHDDLCLQRYLPPVQGKDLQSIHQATNSLSLTLCVRNDVNCQKTDANTFIISIVQWKRHLAFHGIYEPYVMVFRQNAPFELYGISSKALWINGRKPADTAHGQPAEDPAGMGNSEQFFITSMSWKAPGQTYHGYLDDVLFLNFGIEDTTTGAMDILAADLVKHLGLCDREQTAAPF